MREIRHKHLGPFVGAEIEFLDCEIKTIQYIPMALLGREAALYKSKWFDYRRLHPLTTTYYFVECYNRAFGDFIRMAIDETKKHTKAISGGDFLNSREAPAFWRLRQHCDELGIRYDFFLANAMNWSFKNGWLNPPRPQHISSNTDMLVDIVIAWETLCNASLQFPQDDCYCASKFVGAEHQLAFEDFVVAQIKARTHRQYALHAALYVYQVLRIERALIEFDQDHIHQAIKTAESELKTK